MNRRSLHNIIINYWWRHLLVLVVVIVFVNLGQWQLRRLEQRRELNRAIETGLSQPAIALTGEAVDPETLHLRRVTVTGAFDNANSVVLRNRSLQGQPGVHLITPLQIAGSDTAVLVDRGWIPLEQSTPEARREYDIEGQITLEGVAHRTQTRPDAYLVPTDPEPEPGGRLDAWFRVDIERIQKQVAMPLLPVFVEQSPEDGADPYMPPVREENIDLGDGPHLGYAVQWFSFAVILVVIYAVLIRQELRQEGQT